MDTQHPNSHAHHHTMHHTEEPPAEPGYPEHPEQAYAAHHGHGSQDHHGGGHDKHPGHSVEMFREKFWLSLLLTIPTVIWGHMLMQLTGYHPPAFSGSQWIAPVFGSAVFAYGGWVFLQGAWRELKDRLPGIMTLISLAIMVAFLFSVAVALGFRGMPLWDELATLVTIMLLGHWIEMRSIFQAQGALNELAKLLPNIATRVVGDHTEDVPVSALKQGELVLIRPGASVPADGVVREGRSAVNESMITGESRPVEKGQGEPVIAGTTNGSGSLRVEVTGIGDQTALAGIMRLVAQAQTSRSSAQALADRAAFWLTIVAVGAGILTLIVWLALSGDPAFAIERMVTVLVIACPHALGLAIPLVIAISTTLGARSGLLVRNRRGLEEARNLNAVVFDKTGTLTLGEHRVVGTTTAHGFTADEALRLAAAIERDSEHPVARAIVESARERGLVVPSAAGFEAIPGHGIRAVVDGREIHAGGPNLLRKLGAEAVPELRAAADRAGERGQGVIYLVEAGRVLAAFAVADARELGIDTVFAQVLPGQKADTIRELQAQGKRVATVGDGVNDAPALLTADVGIAIGAGTDVAVEAGDVVLVRNDPRDVARIVELSKATYRKLIQNLWWAAGYNIVAIPLAAGVLQPWGFVLHPAIGAVLMSASTVIVAVNAQLLPRAV